MHLSPCPQCRQLVRLPVKASRSAMLQCPFCEHQMTLGTLLDAVPSWTVVDDPQPETPYLVSLTAESLSLISDQPTGTSTVSARSTDTLNVSSDSVTEEAESEEETADYELQAVTPNATASPKSSSTSGGNVPKADATRKVPVRQGDWANFKPLTHEDYQKRRRAQKSPLWSFVQVALGGVAAIPISLLLIWHLLGKDVFDAGPAVARYVPWIVPQKFHPYKETDVEFIDNRTAKGTSSGLSRDFGKELSGSRPVQRPPQEPVTLSDDSKAKEKEKSAEENMTDDPFDLEASAAAVADEDSKDSEVKEPIPEDPIAISLTQADAAIEAWKSNTVEEIDVRRKLAQTFYESICAVPAAFSASEQTEAALRLWYDRLKTLNQQIAEDSSLQGMVRMASRVKLNQGNLSGGFVTVLTIESTLSDDGIVRCSTDSGTKEAPAKSTFDMRIAGRSLLVPEPGTQVLAMVTITSQAAPAGDAAQASDPKDTAAEPSADAPASDVPPSETPVSDAATPTGTVYSWVIIP